MPPTHRDKAGVLAGPLYCTVGSLRDALARLPDDALVMTMIESPIGDLPQVVCGSHFFLSEHNARQILILDILPYDGDGPFAPGHGPAGPRESRRDRRRRR